MRALFAVLTILRAELTAPGIAKFLLYYNAILVFPLAAMIALRWTLGERSDRIFATVARFIEHWAKRLLLYGFVVPGVVLVVDAAGWFFGFPLLPAYLLESTAR